MTSEPADGLGPQMDDLLDAIVALPDRATAARFFRDLCTLRELHDMAQRWHVVQLLDMGRSYTEISRETGASTATITRIAQWLHHGTGGYRDALVRGAGVAANPGRSTALIRPDPSTTKDRMTSSSPLLMDAAALSSLTDAGRLRLAIPNKGRLMEPTVALLRDAGISFDDSTRSLFARVEEYPIDILSVRTDDIAEFVADGVADLGITGTNLLVESQVDLPVALELGYGRCRLEAAVPDSHPAQHLEDLAGLRIATSHPNSTRRVFAERGIAVEIVPISGAVEVAPRLGVADAIVDLVSTGSTLAMNGLRRIGELVRSQAIVVAAPETSPARKAIADELLTMLGAVVAGRRVKYLMMNAPLASLARIEEVLPGLESPSVIPLAHEGMVAVHAVVGSRDVHTLLPRLRAAGASGILVIPVEKLLP